MKVEIWSDSSGAQETDAVLDVLRQVWDETPPPLVEDAEGLWGRDGRAAPGTLHAHP